MDSRIDGTTRLEMVSLPRVWKKLACAWREAGGGGGLFGTLTSDGYKTSRLFSVLSASEIST
jgi:hypothetical protein